MNSGLAILLVLIVLGGAALNIWLFVVSVQFLRTGTKAFKRYTEMNPALPNLPSRPTGAVPPPYTAGPHHQSGA